jgi:PAS domain S-box-containing protein
LISKKKAMKKFNKPSDELISRAVDVSNTAFCVVDVLADDMPIVYANKAFEVLTGYTEPEILGRNCRFLQGHDKDQPALSTIRDALMSGESCLAMLRNYKKDGTVFLNELRLSPVRDDNGTVTHFVGCQSEVPYLNLAVLQNEALNRLARLTDREQEMLSLIVSGKSTKTSARSLGISPRTAEKHRHSVLRKMEVGNIAELVPYKMAAER